ncbi:hypothetical protein [Planctomycetes bacterium Pla163]|uniref:hypothetical protein n=1 Tax=Rohdeia mirabilis TaxID=2528008 RepID=UPI0011A35C80
MLNIAAKELSWINRSSDDPSDQCAHGRVLIAHGDSVLASPTEGEWTVSATGLYLLRTIEDDHTPESTVAETNFLLPCCGFNAWEIGQRYAVLCMGCPTGIDVWVRHLDSSVLLSRGPTEVEVGKDEWATAVRSFARQIEGYYSQSSPKEKPTDDLNEAGWRAFWQEWNARMGRTGRGDT